MTNLVSLSEQSGLSVATINRVIRGGFDPALLDFALFVGFQFHADDLKVLNAPSEHLDPDDNRADGWVADLILQLIERFFLFRFAKRELIH